MAPKMVQMIIRGTTLIVLLISYLIHSEGEGLTPASHFVISGVLGGFCVVTLGLLIEAGMNKTSDKFVEAVFLLNAVLLLAATTILLFSIFFNSPYATIHMTKGILSTLCTALYIIDLIFLNV